MLNSEQVYQRFDFHMVFTKTKDFIDTYNESQCKMTSKLNANHRATAELIIRLYLKQLNSRPHSIQKGDIIGFKTYNSSLASCKGCTKRTIINHKERLKQSGFIIQEEHQGANGIELWINPDILFHGQKNVVSLRKNYMKILPGKPFLSSKEKNFHPLVHEPHEHDNNNSTVDNVKGVRPKAHGDGLSRQKGRDEPTGTRHELYMNTGENAKSASESQKNNSDEADRISLLVLVKQFWEFARKILYPDLILSDPEERDIMNKIWAAVYLKFSSPGSFQQWGAYHEQALERIIIVRKWLDRSPHHWIPSPHVYFNPNNEKNGFQKTLDWLVKREILKIEIKKQLELQKIRREQKLHEEGRGRYKTLSRLQLFKTHEQRLRKMRDPDLLRSYYISLTNNFNLDKRKEP